MLAGKTVLLIAPQFFGYEREIKAELEHLGANVIYFDERPKNDFFTKAFIRLNLKSIISKRINSYYQNIIDSTKGLSVDYLFLVAPETISASYIDKLKLLHSGLKVYTYFWDSVKNKINALSYLDLSDKFYSFDSNDIKIDKRIIFLPLFYIKDYEQIKQITSEPVHDIAFIGTAHSDRYDLVKKIESQAVNYNLRLFFYFYSPSKILFYFQRVFKKEFKKFALNDIYFKPLSKKEVSELIKKSKVVIDIHHPQQAGLTMRTIEMLGAGKKIITTNKNVTKYDFFNEANVHFIERDAPELNLEFCLSEYHDIPQEIYVKYYLKNWLIKIFTE